MIRVSMVPRALAWLWAANLACAQSISVEEKLDQILQAVQRLEQRVRELEQRLGQQPAPPTQSAAAHPSPQSSDQKSSPAAKSQPHSPFSIVAASIGPHGPGEALTFQGRARFFQPWGDLLAVQSEIEYNYFHDRQEAQFDGGAAVRFTPWLQSGFFASFKHVSLPDLNAGGTLGQASLMLDSIFPHHKSPQPESRFSGRAGVFLTRSFLDNRLIAHQDNAGFSSDIYLRAFNQAGANVQLNWARWAHFRSPSIEFQYARLQYSGPRAGFYDYGSGVSAANADNANSGYVRFIKPVNKDRTISMTFQFDANPGLVTANRTDFRGLVGLQFGLSPQRVLEADSRAAVPFEIPRIRYAVLQNVHLHAPVADAGPSQLNLPAGNIVLDGSRSHSADGRTDTLSYEWTQISGTRVSVQNANQARASFAASAPGTYAFQLRVTDARDHQSAVSATTVSILETSAPKIVSFAANPPMIDLGGKSQLSWNVENADTVTIAPAVDTGNQRQGSATVQPAQTTVYTLTAKSGSESISQSVTVQIGSLRIVSFQASPQSVKAGDSVTLDWQVENAKTVGITADDPNFSGSAQLSLNGHMTIHPNRTATYTLQAGNGTDSLTASVTVAVAPEKAPVILRFIADPARFDGPGTVTLAWQTLNATSASIDHNVGKVDASGSVSVPVNDTTTFTLMASNGSATVSLPVTVRIIPRILTFTISAPDSGNNVTLQWTTQHATSVDILPNAGTGLAASGTKIVHLTSSQTFTLVAHGDSEQVSASAQAVLPASPFPPTAAITRGANLSLERVMLDGSGSFDPQGLPLTYSWRQVFGPPATIESPGATGTVVNLPSSGTYTFELTVTNSANESGRARITLSPLP